MICPKCKHEFTAPQAGREAVITHKEAIEAYGLIASGQLSDGTVFMQRLLARPPTNDEREAT